MHLPDFPLRLGTRASPLALAQSRLVCAALEARHGFTPDRIRIVPVETTGDRVQDRPLAEIGGKALWTKELDRALLTGEVDFAVHSMKDVETALPPGIALAGVLERADPRDRLVGAESLEQIAQGALVGTSSPRRAAQLLNRRPDLRVTSLRGNVDTRLRQIAEGKLAATFLAAAGLERLGKAVGTALPLEEWLPAASQGIVGITCRADDGATRDLFEAVTHGPSLTSLLAERAVLEGLGGSCSTAVAVHAMAGAKIRLTAQLFSPDGRERVEVSAFEEGDPRDLGLALAQDLLSRATPAIRASLSPVSR